jgi:hypothetical protein
MYAGSASSVTAAENWAESAMTAAPQTRPKASSAAAGQPWAQGVSRQHAPDTTMAVMATVVRPRRSAAQPAPTQPMAPATPMMAKAMRRAGCMPSGPSALARNTASHVHAAYSSHMCP